MTAEATCTLEPPAPANADANSVVRDLVARARSGDCRIGALATAEGLQPAADDRLAGGGQVGRDDHEIGVDRSNHEHAPGHGVSPSSASPSIREL